MNAIEKSSQSGVPLYHAFWRIVKDTYIDVARLVDWDSWEHRFDESISSDESAYPFIDLMLSSLGDTYTERLAPGLTAPEASPQSLPQAVQALLRTDGVPYLRIGTFDRDDIADEVSASLEKIADCSAVVLDLRRNGGGKVDQVLKCLPLFIENGLLTTIEVRHEGGIKKREYFVNDQQFFLVETTPDGSQVKEFYERPKPVLAGKLLVLNMDARTASGGEMMVASLAQNAAPGTVKIVGKGKTPGKGIGQIEYDVLDGRARLKITRSRWLTPGGEWVGDCGQTRSEGIEPDILVTDEEDVNACFRASLKAIREMREPQAAA
jgi:C-terminal processing protease CtpA/Prc